MNYFLPKIKNEFTKIEPELQNVVDGMTIIYQSREKRSKAQSNLVKDTNDLIKSEVPRFEKSLKYSLEPFNEIAQIEYELSQSEKRCRDDLNDIIERYKVIREHEIQQKEAVTAVENAKNRLKNAKIAYHNELNNNKISTKLKLAEEEVNKAKKERVNAIEYAKELTINLIEEKKKFAKFKLNRLRHGYKTYANAIVDCTKKEIDIYKQLANNFSEARSQIELLSNKDINELSNSI